MAKIGMLLPRYCPITETETNGVTTETLGTGKIFSKAIKSTVTIQSSNAKMYADDGAAESDKYFQSGTMQFEADDVDDDVGAEIHGETKDETAGDIISGGEDRAPYLRFGYIRRKVVRGVQKFVGIVYLKVQFSIPNDEDETKGETLTYKSTTETADIMHNKDGKWRRRKTCATQADALAYVNGLTNFGIGGGT